MCYYPWRPRITTSTAIACELACEQFWQCRTSCDCESKPLFLSEGWLYVHNCALTASCRTFFCFFCFFLCVAEPPHYWLPHLATWKLSGTVLRAWPSTCPSVPWASSYVRTWPLSVEPPMLPTLQSERSQRASSSSPEQPSQSEQYSQIQPLAAGI